MAVSELRGASRESRAALDERLDETLGSGQEAARVGDDLLAAAALVRSEPSLRRVLVDPSIPGDAKGDLVRRLVGDGLGDEALDLLVRASGSRWTMGRHLPDTLEELGVRATVHSADADHDPNRVADELFAVLRAVNENPPLRDALSDPARSQTDKRDLVRDLLGDRTTAATLRLVEQSLSGTHRTVPLALEEYQRVAAAAHDQRVATVTVARGLADDDSERLSRALSEQYGRAIHLNVVVNPDVLGGVRVTIGDDVIDGTIRARLAEAERTVAR